MIAIRPLAHLVAAPGRTSGPRCELCATPIGDAHRHVVEIGARGVLCACSACAILFGSGERGARYRTIPDRVRIDARFALPPERLGMPVGLAFCFHDSTRHRPVACYPGPAGVVDAELPPEAWDALVAATPLASLLEPDVEALLLHGRRGGSPVRCYLVPITAAYELAGRLRTQWSGFTGGEPADRELAAFFAELDARGQPV